MSNGKTNLELKAKLVKEFGDMCCVCKNKYLIEVYEFYSIEDLKAVGENRNPFKARLVDTDDCVMVCANCRKLLKQGKAVLSSDVIKIKISGLKESVNRQTKIQDQISLFEKVKTKVKDVFKVVSD